MPTARDIAFEVDRELVVRDRSLARASSEPRVLSARRRDVSSSDETQI
jgi:hypothetical protein